MTKMYIGLHVKSCSILMNLLFSRVFRKKNSNVKFMKVRPVGAEYVARERTDDITKG
jgi:hypothetical protein